MAKMIDTIGGIGVIGAIAAISSRYNLIHFVGCIAILLLALAATTLIAYIFNRFYMKNYKDFALVNGLIFSMCVFFVFLLMVGVMAVMH